MKQIAGQIEIPTEIREVGILRGIAVLIKNAITATDDKIVFVTVFDVLAADSVVERLGALGDADGVQIERADKEPQMVAAFPRAQMTGFRAKTQHQTQ